MPTPARARSGRRRAAGGKILARLRTLIASFLTRWTPLRKKTRRRRGFLQPSRALPHGALGGLIDTFSRRDLTDEGRKDEDLLGRVYEYMLGRYAADEGKSGGEFYTPRSVVSLLTEMTRPYRGRIYGTFMPRRIQIRANLVLAA